MKSSKNFTKLFLVIVGCLIFGGLSIFSVSAQEAVDLPAFTGQNILTLERYTGTEPGDVTTQTFRNLSDKDEIRVTRGRYRSIEPNRIVINFRVAQDVKWRKGITVYKKISSGPDQGKWRRLQHVYTQNCTACAQTISLRVNELDGVALSFEKAKAFGAHTPMYVIYLDSRRTDLGGQQITFIWEKDN